MSRVFFFVLLLMAGTATGLARAAEFRIGVNAEVSYAEDPDEVRQRYADLLSELGKATGNRFVFSPVYSDKVAKGLAEGQLDFMLIHTHLALNAVSKSGYQLVGFTHDRKNDRVHFFVRPDSPIKTLKEIARASISSPGRQSWATQTARVTLRATTPGIEPNFMVTRLQDAVPIAVQLKVASVGISRSQKLVDASVKQNQVRIVHSTTPLPVNAVIAAPRVSKATVDAVRKALSAMAGSSLFDELGFDGLRYSDEEAARLQAFYSQ